jgi:acetoin utilization protein AcuB
MGALLKNIPTIQSVMTPFPHSVEPNAPLRMARRRMEEFEIRHLPVASEGKLVGVISDRDLKRALDPALGLPPKDELFVDDVMVHEPYVVETQTPLDGVLLEMADRHIGCALVVKKGKLVGLFTTTDACRVFGESLRGKRSASDGDDAA